MARERNRKLLNYGTVLSYLILSVIINFTVVIFVYILILIIYYFLELLLRYLSSNIPFFFNYYQLLLHNHGGPSRICLNNTFYLKRVLQKFTRLKMLIIVKPEISIMNRLYTSAEIHRERPLLHFR